MKVFMGLVFGLSSLGGRALAEPTSFTADADIGIREYFGSATFGDSQVVIGGTTGPLSSSGHNRGLFHFTLAGIPAGALITDVQLTFDVVRVPPVPVDAVFGLRPILQSWSENMATWNNPGAGWHGAGGVAGLDYASVNSASLLINPAVGAYTFAATDGLKADVQAWVNNPLANFGWMLLPEQEDVDYSARQFASKEGGAPASLLVSYVVPEPAARGLLMASLGALFLGRWRQESRQGSSNSRPVRFG